MYCTVVHYWTLTPLHCSELYSDALYITARSTLQHTAVHYSTLQYTEAHCSTLQYTAVHCSTLQYTTVHWSTLQYTTVHCSTLLYTTVHYSTLQYTTVHWSTLQYTTVHCSTLQYTAVHYSTLQYTAAHCCTLQYTTVHCSTLQYTTVHYSTLKHTAVHYSALQHTAVHYSTLQCTPVHCSTLQYTTVHCSTLQYTAVHYSTLQYSYECTLNYTAHYSMLQYTVSLDASKVRGPQEYILHYITLHYRPPGIHITLHYITLHYITLHYRPQGHTPTTRALVCIFDSYLDIYPSLSYISVNLNTFSVRLMCVSQFKTIIYITRKVGRPPSSQFSNTCGELVAFGHLRALLALWIAVWRAVLSETTAVRTELPDLRAAPSLCSIYWQRPQLLQLNWW